MKYNNSVHTATGLAPIEIHIGRMPRLPQTIFERRNVGGHQSLDRDIREYHDLLSHRLRLTYDLVREQNQINLAKANSANAMLDAVMHKRPVWKVGEWVWVYNDVQTIRQGASADQASPDKVLTAKLSLNWTGPWKILGVGPSATAPDDRPLGEKLLYLDFPTDEAGPAPKNRVSVLRCKPCIAPHDSTDMPQQLPLGLSQYVLSKHATKSPPFHVTAEDVDAPVERVVVDHISGHQLVRGRGGKIAVMYEIHWKGLTRVTWEREIDLRHFRRQILLYWVGDTAQHRPLNRRYRSMRKGAAARELAREHSARFVVAGYRLVSRAQYLLSFRRKRLPKGAFFWYKAQDSLWWLGKIHAPVPDSNDGYYIRFLDDPGPLRIILDDAYYTEAPSARRGSWCLQRHDTGNIDDAILRNADNSWNDSEP